MQDTRRRGSPWQPTNNAHAAGTKRSVWEVDESFLEAEAAEANNAQAIPDELGVLQTDLTRAHRNLPISIISVTNPETKVTENSAKDRVAEGEQAHGSYQELRDKLANLNREARIKEDLRHAERNAEFLEERRRKASQPVQKEVPHQPPAPPRQPERGNRKRGQRDRLRSDANARDAQMARILAQRRSTFITRLRQRLRQEEDRRSLLERLRDKWLEHQRRQEQLKLAKTYRAERERLEQRNFAQERLQGRRSKKNPDRSHGELSKRLRDRANAKRAEERTRLEKRYRAERERIDRKYRQRRTKVDNPPQNRFQKLVKLIRYKLMRQRVRRQRFQRLRFRRQRLRRQRPQRDQRAVRLRRERQVRTRRRTQRVRRLRRERQRQVRQRQARQQRVSRKRHVQRERQQQQRARQEHRRREDQHREHRREDHYRRAHQDRGRGGW